MGRRLRYGDTASLGRSKIVRYRRGESPSDRHARRLYSNLDHEETVRAWTQRSGIRLQISNEGHHWRFTFGTEVAEWWPSSAKLVMNRDYPGGIHAHDCDQVREYLTGMWGLVRRDASARSDDGGKEPATMRSMNSRDIPTAEARSHRMSNSQTAYTASQLAHELGLQALTVGKIFASMKTVRGGRQFNVGLKIKSTSRDVSNPGWAQQVGGRWFYGELARSALREYVNRFPNVVKAIENSSSIAFDGEFSDAELAECYEWAKSFRGKTYRRVDVMSGKDLTRER